MCVNPETVRALGSNYVYSKFGDEKVGGRSLSDTVFRSYFFLCPEHVASLYSEVCDAFPELGYYRNGVTYNVKFLLWTIFYMHAYWTVQMSSDWVGVTRKTFMTHVNKTLEALNVVYSENVSTRE